MVTRVLRRAVVAVLAAAVATQIVGCGRSHEPDSYTWRGDVAPGAWVRIDNVNGPIRVARAEGREAVVTATKRYRGRRPEMVRMLSERAGADVQLCAAYGSRASKCSQRGGSHTGLLGRLFRRTSPTEMEFVVAVPAGVRVQARTVNGNVVVADAGSEIRATTVNGSVVIGASGGPVRARTVNGSVTARLAALAPGAAVALASTNGRVTAMLPASLDAALDLATTNGRISSDFPLAPSTPRAHRLHGIVGTGGRPVELKTVNGDVRLEQVR
jgi:hypothetical protein